MRKKNRNNAIHFITIFCLLLSTYIQEVHVGLCDSVVKRPLNLWAGVHVHVASVCLLFYTTYLLNSWYWKKTWQMHYLTSILINSLTRFQLIPVFDSLVYEFLAGLGKYQSRQFSSSPNIEIQKFVAWHLEKILLISLGIIVCP